MNYTPGHDTVVELHDLTKTYRSDGQRNAGVKEISLSASSGEMILFLGPSGSGKTTILALIAGLLRPTSGRVALFGTSIEAYTLAQLQYLRATRIGFVFQSFRLLDALSVIDNIALPLRFRGLSRAAARKNAGTVLQRLQIEHLQFAFPTHLSQGEKQRVAVARAFATNPTLILADEPTASLATEQGLEIIRMLQRYASEHAACVMVASHDLRMATCASRVFHLQDGRIIAS